jgi:hypothetical protein
VCVCVCVCGGGGGVSAWQPPTPNLNLKNVYSVDMIISNVFFVIYPSAEISHCNRLMNNTLDFEK